MIFPSDGIETIYIWVDENSNDSHHNGDRNRDLNHPAHIWRVSTLGASLSSGNRESLCKILFAITVSPSRNRNFGRMQSRSRFESLAVMNPGPRMDRMNSRRAVQYLALRTHVTYRWE